jgi:hypothetical protein
MNKISKPLLLEALTRLGELAEQEGIRLEVCLYGGAVMMLAYDVREMTKDVDAIIHPNKEGRELAKVVGRELGLGEDWLNDQVKVFIAPQEQLRSLPWESPGIMLTAPTASYLLAMKALACREPLPGYEGDIEDLRFLIKKLGITSVDEVQSHIDRYYPDDVIRPGHRLLLECMINEESST